MKIDVVVYDRPVREIEFSFISFDEFLSVLPHFERVRDLLTLLHTAYKSSAIGGQLSH